MSKSVIQVGLWRLFTGCLKILARSENRARNVEHAVPHMVSDLLPLGVGAHGQVLLHLAQLVDVPLNTKTNTDDDYSKNRANSVIYLVPHIKPRL